MEQQGGRDCTTPATRALNQPPLFVSNLQPVPLALHYVGSGRRLSAVRAAVAIASALASVLAWASPLETGALQQAPTATLLTTENFRASPNGAIIGRLLAGSRVAVVSVRGPWLEIEVKGAIWSESVSPTTRGGFDLEVSVAGGENLRTEPRGEVLARLDRGALLRESGSEPRWHHVRRRGYLWSASARLGSEGAGRVIELPVSGAAIVGSPDGDTIALAFEGAPLVVDGRRGGWLRVRLEGWTWLPPGAVAAPEGDPGPGPTPEEFALAPESFVGRTVSWELSFVAAERANAAQLDFIEGETYLIATTGSDADFVYVVLPPHMLELASGLAPLERFTATGVVRTGASSLTGVPVVDLLVIERGGAS